MNNALVTLIGESHVWKYGCQVLKDLATSDAYAFYNNIILIPELGVGCWSIGRFDSPNSGAIEMRCVLFACMIIIESRVGVGRVSFGYFWFLREVERMEEKIRVPNAKKVTHPHYAKNHHHDLVRDVMLLSRMHLLHLLPPANSSTCSMKLSLACYDIVSSNHKL